MSRISLLLLLLIQVELYSSQNVSNSTVPCSIPAFSSTGVIVAGGNNQGNQPNQLSFPYGIYIDGNNSLYIGDTGNDRIQWWLPGATTGITVAGGQGFGSNASQLDGGRDVYLNAANQLLVLDTGNLRLQQFNRSSTSMIGTTVMTNLPLSCRNMFMETTTNTLYISDMHNHRVLRMPSAVVVAGGNGFGSQSNQLYFPAGLYVTPTGVIYVADPFNDRVQMWLPGASVGITVAGGNGRGSAANQLNSPMHVIYMPSTGNLIVTDSGNARIQIWAPNATCGITVISDQFTYPMTSTLDRLNQNLYVVDQVACRVKRFALISNNNLCVPPNCSIITVTITATTTVLSTPDSLTASIDETIPPWVIVLIIVVSAFIFTMGLFIHILRKMIKAR